MNSLEQKIQYKRKMNESYQVNTIFEGNLLIHELEMLRRNQLPGLLPIEFMVADGKGQFWYRITGLQSLEDMKKTGRFKEKELKNLVSGLCIVLENVEGYLLREEGIELSQIYFSAEGNRVYFPYSPIRSREPLPLKQRFLELLDELIKESANADSGYVQYLFFVYDVLRRENGCIKDALADEKADSSYEQRRHSEMPMPQAAPLLERLTIEDLESMEEGADCREEGSDNEKEGWLHRFFKNQLLDLKWGAKKKIRQYKDIRPEKWEEEYIVRPPQEEQDSKTRMLGGDLIKTDCGRLHFEDEKEPDILLTENQYVLGKRKEYADLVVEDASVSRVHALIKREEDGYYLEDLNSLNGTFLNGIQLSLKEKVLLKEEDEIVVGTSHLVFYTNA